MGTAFETITSYVAGLDPASELSSGFHFVDVPLGVPIKVILSATELVLVLRVSRRYS